MDNKNDNWRLKWLSAPLMKLFRKVTPTMSRTEQEALEAAQKAVAIGGPMREVYESTLEEIQSKN